MLEQESKVTGGGWYVHPNKQADTSEARELHVSLPLSF